MSNPVSTAKILKTSEAARELGLQPDQFRRLAIKAGVQGKKHRRSDLWSQADVEQVRALLAADE